MGRVRVVLPDRETVGDIVQEHAGAALFKVAHGNKETTWQPSHRAIRVLASAPVADTPQIVELTTAPPTGRMVAATTAISQGDIVFSAPAFSVVLAQAHAQTHCHQCFAKLRGSVVQCGSCQRARYCDRGCMQQHFGLHDAACDALLHLDVLPADFDLVRLALACVVMEIALNNPSVITGLTIHAVVSKETKRYAKYAALLLKHLPPLDRPEWLHVSHITDVFVALRFNAHPIVVDLHSSALGLGIFPDAARMINHACRPTTFPTYNRQTRALNFRAVESLAPGALVTYSYLDVFGFGLLEPRSARHRVLATTFGFECNCGRCAEGDNDATTTLTPCDKLLAQLDDAVQRHQWPLVVAVASQLLAEWQAQRLPTAYPLVYLLHTKIATACRQMNVSDTVAREAAANAAALCGFAS
ncbi:N-lysine methyltransferase SMYD2-B isoform X1 [Achlya hypogyna]|uniref:N-lysine methyltransferase SMYD2-B isoform X1 n=1 Tax=Achlya hypogyna TaxID=1202772 RepID=A0A1V9YH84_ACHHY|nr:N-lysine methyltransferase SMYD2-B isoform X1 [Achlya hypogyna]